MKGIAAHFHGWKLVLIMVLAAVASSTVLYAWSRQQLSWAPAEVTEFRPEVNASRVALLPVQASSAEGTARAKLESAGLALEGPAFVQAVAMRHRSLVQLFRQAGQDVNALGASGRTALLTAALGKDWPLFDELLAAGANPNLADDTGLTPLMAAAAAGRAGQVAALLEHGARAADQDDAGGQAAHYAVAAKALDCLKLLLAEEIPVTDEKRPEHSLLAQAYGTGEWRYIEPVLARAPEGMSWEPQSRAALKLAFDARDQEKLALLFAHYDGAATLEGKAQPLLAYAVVDNDLARLKMLLDCGADPNTKLGNTVEKDFSQRILRESFRSYVVSEGGMTTLMLAAGLGRADLVKALLEKGARRGLPTDRYKLVALSFAAMTENAAVMQMLIDDSPRPDQMRVEVSLGSQRATVLRNGQSVYSTRICSGRPGFATPTGDFVVTDKHATHKSTIYKVDMPFFMRLNCRDFGMHQGAIQESPSSHGCIRLPSESARQLFKQVPVGTLVSIRD